MVAINDNFNNLTKIFDKKSSSGQSEELFAELFAIFNSEFSENIDNNLSEKLKKEMSSPVINLEENSQDILNKDGVIHQNVNQTEIDLAKDLINVFYKDFGIDITNLNKTKERNSSIKSSTPSNIAIPSTFNQKITKKDNLSLKNAEDTLTNDKKPNLVIKIEKSSSKTDKLQWDYKSQNYAKRDYFEKSEKILSKDEDLNLKQFKNENTSKLIDKKIKKKTKQIQMHQTKDINNENSKVLNNLRQIDKAVSNIKNTVKKNVENNVAQKKSETKKWDQSFDNTKKSILNTNNQQFLDLMESSWGEKFSKIIKNSVNNGIKSLELHLKPKNLGKLNLEVTLKNNNTHIHISSENQDVVNILNDNLAKISDIIDKETKSFSSFMNNQNSQDNFLGNRENNEKRYSEKLSDKKSNTLERKSEKLSNHNIDVNA